MCLCLRNLATQHGYLAVCTRGSLSLLFSLLSLALGDALVGQHVAPDSLNKDSRR